MIDFIATDEHGELLGSSLDTYDTYPAPGDRIRLHGYGKAGPTYEVVRREFLPWALAPDQEREGEITLVLRELPDVVMIHVDASTDSRVADGHRPG